MQYTYNLSQGRLSLSAREGVLRKGDQSEEPTSIVSMTGTIEHVLRQEGTKRLEELIDYLGNWQDNLKTYTDLVNNYFLQGGSTKLWFKPIDLAQG